MKTKKNILNIYLFKREKKNVCLFFSFFSFSSFFSLSPHHTSLWTNPPNPTPQPCTTSNAEEALLVQPNSSIILCRPPTVRLFDPRFPMLYAVGWSQNKGSRANIKTVDREEVDRLRKRFMKLDKVCSLSES